MNLSVLGAWAITGRPYFLVFFPLMFLFSSVLVVLSPWKEKLHSDTPSIVQQYHKACECCHHQNLEPSQRKIELVVPKDSSVDSQVTFGNTTLNLQNL